MKKLFLFVSIVSFLFTVGLFTGGSVFAVDRPNILWLTCEDTGRHLGSYGFPGAETPVLDKLASRGTRYMHAWSNYPVCAPARTTIITGCYPASLGAEQMRSRVPLPESIKMFPHYLRETGYYCANNVKEDYNVFNRSGPTPWNDSSKNAHWKNRDEDQPFFAVFNITVTHESQIRNKYQLKRDPAQTPVPGYHPNTPEVRRDWTQYHERITEMDAQFALRLDELDRSVAEDTIIFFFGDHGSGMPRNKRTPLDCGLGVPMIVYFPPKYRHLAPEEYRENGVAEQLVSFVDLAPTVLSLAGIEPPKHMQGIAFAGTFAGKRDYLYGFRGRMDERADLVRSISDGRYVYARNYHPEIIYGSRNAYMFETRTTQIWRELYDAGKLPREQAFFWQLKPTEELYDLKTDPDEIVNLADSKDHREIMELLKSALNRHILETRDVHFLPENMLHDRFGDTSPWDLGRDPKKYPMEKVFVAADRATDRTTAVSSLEQFVRDPEPAVRYWGAIGMLLRLADTAGPDGTKPTEATKRMLEQRRAVVTTLLADPEPAVRIVAAEILGRYGNEADVELAVKILIADAKSKSGTTYTTWLALESLDRFAARCHRYKVEINRVTEIEFEGRIKVLVSKIMESIKQQLR